MKKKYFVLKNWRKNMPAEMYLISSKVLLNMANNTNFATPPVTMAAMNAANTRLDTAYANRRNGPAAKIELESAALDVDTVLRLQADYVDDVAKGDPAIIESSGFAMSKGEATKATTPETPSYLKLTSSNGNMCMTTKKPKGATSCCWVIATGTTIPELHIENDMLVIPTGSNVSIIPAGKSREVIGGLKPGTPMIVQVMAQNAAGKSMLSAPATIYINK